MSDNSPRFLHSFKDTWDDHLIRLRSMVVDGYWHIKENRLKFGTKEEDFKHTQKATEDCLESLEVFISEATGQRDKPGVQVYIKEILSTINIHLDRIKKYYPKNNPKGFKTKDSKREEGKFQRLVFKGERLIKDKIKDLNIDNDMSNVIVDFYEGGIATIPMKKVLEKRSSTLRAKIESLEVDWDLIMDNGLFINMKKKDIPEYNEEAHFWDQEIPTLQFWISEYNKICKGYTIDGYHITPHLYFHINFFKTPIKSQNNEITNAPLRDNEWYVNEIKKYAEEKALEMERAGVIIYGTRRFSKTTQEVSYIHHGILIYPTETGTASSSNAEDLESIVDKLRKTLDYVVPAFRLKVVSGKSFDTKTPVLFGLKNSNGSSTYEHFSLRIINTDGGSKKGSQKMAGGNPKVYISDEIGKSEFIKSHEAAIPSFESDEGWVCIPMYTGTGGEEDLSADAEKVLSNPANHGFLEMDWSILEYRIPPEAITWERRKFGWFIPAQMSTYTGMRKIKTNFAEFLGIESEQLAKIEFWKTDWIHNSEKIKEIRSKLTGTSLTSEKVFRPIDPEECFMSAKNNPFDAGYAKKLKDRYIAKGNEKHGTATPIRLKKEDGKISYDLDLKSPVAIYPHPGKFIDSPGLLFGEFPKFKPPMWQFTAGYDDYKHEESDGDSVCGFYIFDRISRRIVYSLATRPDPHKASYKEIHMALDAWNCKVLPENEDMGILEYFNRLHVTDSYIEKKFDAFGDFTKFATNRKYGWQPDKFTAPFVRNLVIDYTKEITEHQNDKGEVIDTEKGMDRVEDIHLLEEFIKYKEDGNFDRIVGFGSCLLYDYYLTSKRIFPRVNKRDREEVEEWKPKKTPQQRRAERRRKML